MNKLIVEGISLTVIFWLETLFPLFKGRQHRFRHGFHNISMGVINGLAGTLSFSILTVYVIRLCTAHSFGLIHWQALPQSVSAAAAFILFDLWMYVWHAANHKMPFFWRFHRMHHSDPDVDTTTALRFHLGEIAISSILRLPVIALLGMEFRHLLIYEMSLQVVILFHHSNVALPENIDRILRAVIVTPNMHRVHHSRERFETDSNYSSIFSFWDRIGRTFRLRQDPRTLHYGLSYLDDPHWQTLTGMFKTPFVRIPPR
jgi:sterol desaturase/sphingolipid hydroxylase (fatty acid hydroxylase superfamily)